LPALAQFSPISQPVASYTSGTSLIALVGTDGASVSSITDGVQTVSLSQAMSLATVPATWGTWGSPPNTETSTPRVLAVFSSATITYTLSRPSNTFGFELEPNNAGNYNVTTTFLNGTIVLGSVSRVISGHNGALLEAASSSSPITAVVVSADPGANGFAVAQFRYALASTSVPALNTTALISLGVLLLAIGAMFARRSAKPAAA
jgi:hypothetical protein